MKIRLAGLESHSSVNGPGVRFVIFTQGCPHKCNGCQNPETWDLLGGNEFDVLDLVSTIVNTKYIDGVTLSGGDPFYQGEAILELCKLLKERGVESIWAYSGWTFEQLSSGQVSSQAKEALNYIDVLVDGPFILSRLDENCLFRGSNNQRLIDVKGSLSLGKIVEVSELDFGL
jgi:anaerobic ribonucleoside-triphosphate reductase activating protein